MGAPPDSDRTAIQGFHPVHRVAQSYLGSLWIAIDKREGDPGTPVLLRRLQLPGNLSVEARERVARAGHDALGLRHPNVLSVIEVLEQPGVELAIAHEHVEAEPLRSLQSWANLRGLNFPVGVSLRIVSDLLQGVSALHALAGSASVAPFGGLSPDSVLVSRAGDTRLCDPLVASCASLLEGVGFNTAKLAYAAPEQVHAVASLTPACDVFTCGALLWELLAARRLLSGSRPAMERKLLEHNLPNLATSLRSDQQVASGLIDLVGRALCADPEQRPPDAAALRAELQHCGHELASLQQVAQFVGKLSGQRFDRRSAAMRLKSLPELEAPLEWPIEVPSASSTSSRRSPRAGAAPPSQPLTERSSDPSPPASTAVSSARREPAAPAALPAVPTTPVRPALARPAAAPRPGPALSPSASVAVNAPRPEPRPAALREEPPATPTAIRRTSPSYVEPPPIPESVPGDDEDSTVIDPPPEDWWGTEPATPAVVAQPAPAPAALRAAPAVPIPEPDLGRRTSLGIGKPAHPVLSATLPFTNLTPKPFTAPDGSQPAAPAFPAASPGATALRSLPPGIPSLRGYEPTFALAPEGLVPRVAPSARVTRPRSGWARALGLGAGGGRGRRLLAAAAACLALGGLVVGALLLRGPRPLPVLAPAATPLAQRGPEPEPAPPSEPVTQDTPAPDSNAPDAATAQAAPTPAPPAAGAATAQTAQAGELDAPRLDDGQLLRLFALEQHEDVPNCPERAPAGKAVRGKKASAKEAVRLLKVARGELKRGKREQAHGLLCRATTHDPSNSRAQQALAELSLQLGKPAQAQAAAEQALARKPEDPTLLGILGDALALSGDLPGSRRAWLRSVRSPGSDVERLQLLESNYRKMGDRLLRTSSYAAACALFRRAVVLSEGSYAPSIGLAESLRRLRQPRAALAWAERAAHAFPKDSRVQVLYGNTLFDNGRQKEAWAAWRAARAPAPKLAKGKP